MKNFILIGAAGYVAPRHMQAIKDIGGNLIAALDPNESVGILDKFFPNCEFFTEFERLQRHCYKLKRDGVKIDYVSICSPNYLHDAHCTFALQIGADAICEKPLVLHTRNLRSLQQLEKETNHKIWAIVQFRHHPDVIEIKRMIHGYSNNYPTNYNIDIKYIAPRGKWYESTWKTDIEKSGGVSTNIGIHLFDIVSYMFGEPTYGFGFNNFKIYKKVNNRFTASGQMNYANAICKWFLSTRYPDVSEEMESIRTFKIGSYNLDLSSYDAQDLHNKSYKAILAKKGFGIEDVFPSIKTCEHIRNLYRGSP